MSSTLTDGAENVQDAGGLTAFLEEYGVGGVLWAAFIGIADTINSAFNLVTTPFDSTASGLEDVIDETFADAIIGSGVDVAVNAFESGLTNMLGPFAFPAAVLIVMLGIMIFMWFAGTIAYAPWVFLSGGD